MTTNISSYDVLACYYDKIYNYQKSNKSIHEITNFIKNIMSKVEKRDNFLDIGCGTGIYTNLIHEYFNKSIGIDPCKSMIEKCENKNIDFQCAFLNEINRENYNFISCFSQILNHLSNIELLEEFIQDVSIRLVHGGIFYFDIFNYDFFIENEPINETRPLSENVKYVIFPEILSQTDNYINLILHNKIVDKDETYPYELSMYIWKLGILETILSKYNIEIKEKCKMFDLSITTLHECPKISIICQKTHNI